MPSLEKYSRELDYSYAPGVFPSMEALTKRPDSVRRLLISEKLEGEGKEKLLEKCAEMRVRVEVADKALSRISGKENCFAAAVVEKHYASLVAGRHVVLHHISDAGNLGTVLRTALGFGYRDIAVIRPAADSYDPRVIRASMGAIFSLRLKEYDDFDQYRKEFPNQMLYPFMLAGSVMLEEAVSAVPPKDSSLIFGNEGAGLPAAFAKMGKPVRIPHSNDIDSLNLSIAAAIGMYAFMNAGGK